MGLAVREPELVSKCARRESLHNVHIAHSTLLHTFNILQFYLSIIPQ